MQEMYARMAADNADEMIVQIEPIIIGDIKYYGCKRVYLKDTTVKDEDGKEVTKQVINESRPAEYDSFSQLFNDVESHQAISASIIADLAKQKMINAQVMMQIAKLGVLK